MTSQMENCSSIAITFSHLDKKLIHLYLQLLFKKYPCSFVIYAGETIHCFWFDGNVHVAIMLFSAIEYTLIAEEEEIMAHSPDPGITPVVTPKIVEFPSIILVGVETSIATC